MKINLVEKLHALDKQAFDNDEHIYDLQNLYESHKLSDDRKKALAEMLMNENVNSEDVYKFLCEDYNRNNLNEHFNNGTMAEFNPEDLMNKVKSTGQSLHTVRTIGTTEFIISIFFEEWFGPVDEDTEYWIDIVSEDEAGNQERLTSFDDSRHLLDYEVVEKLDAWKTKLLDEYSSALDEDINNKEHSLGKVLYDHKAEIENSATSVSNMLTVINNIVKDNDVKITPAVQKLLDDFKRAKNPSSLLQSIWNVILATDSKENKVINTKRKNEALENNSTPDFTIDKVEYTNEDGTEWNVLETFPVMKSEIIAVTNPATWEHMTKGITREDFERDDAIHWTLGDWIKYVASKKDTDSVAFPRSKYGISWRNVQLVNKDLFDDHITHLQKYLGKKLLPNAFESLHEDVSDEALITARQFKEDVYSKLTQSTDLETLANIVRTIFKENNGGCRVDVYSHSICVDNAWLPCECQTNGKYTFYFIINLNDLGDYNRFAEDLGMWKYKSLGGANIHYTPDLYESKNNNKIPYSIEKIECSDKEWMNEKYHTRTEFMFEHGDRVELIRDVWYDYMANEYISPKDTILKKGSVGTCVGDESFGQVEVQFDDYPGVRAILYTDRLSPIEKPVSGKFYENLNESYNKELYDIANAMQDFLNEHGISWVKLYDMNPDTNTISLEIDGDWKHDHLAADYFLQNEFSDEYDVTKIDGWELEDTGSDWGPEVHVYCISKDFSYEINDEKMSRKTFNDRINQMKHN